MALSGTLAARLWFGLVAFVVCATLGLLPLVGMGMIFLWPVILLLGIGIGPAARAAFPDRTCTACGAAVDPLTAAPQRARQRVASAA